MTSRREFRSFRRSHLLAFSLCSKGFCSVRINAQATVSGAALSKRGSVDLRVSFFGVSGVDLDLVFVDFETTGLNRRRRDEVLEIGIVDGSGRVLMDQLVRPIERKSWKNAQKTHGISPADVADSPTFDALCPVLMDILYGRDVVAYNAPFEIQFMDVPMKGKPASFICCMRLFRKAVPYHPYKLSDATSWAECPAPSFHRAAADALNTLCVWNAIKGHIGHRFDKAVRASIYDPFKPKPRPCCP